LFFFSSAQSLWLNRHFLYFSLLGSFVWAKPNTGKALRNIVHLSRQIHLHVFKTVSSSTSFLLYFPTSLALFPFNWEMKLCNHHFYLNQQISILFFWHTSLCMTVSRSIHICTNDPILFLQMTNIPLYMFHIFFIHSSVIEQFDWFHILAIVNSAAVNTGVHVSFWNYCFLSICPEVELFGHIVVLFLEFFFKGTFILFSIVAVSI